MNKNEEAALQLFDSEICCTAIQLPCFCKENSNRLTDELTNNYANRSQTSL